MSEEKEIATFWDGTHPLSLEFNRLYTLHVPSAGCCETINGELIRAANRLYHEYYNNGNCNAVKWEREQCDTCDGSGVIDEQCDECLGSGQDDDGDECMNCGGSGEYGDSCYNCDGEGTILLELVMDEFYEGFLDFIKKHIPKLTDKVNAVRDLILDKELHSNYKYDNEEQGIYNEFFEGILSQVLEREKGGVDEENPEWAIEQSQLIEDSKN